MNSVFIPILLVCVFFYLEINSIDIERYQWPMIVNSCYFVGGGGDGVCECVFMFPFFWFCWCEIIISCVFMGVVNLYGSEFSL